MNEKIALEEYQSYENAWRSLFGTSKTDHEIDLKTLFEDIRGLTLSYQDYAALMVVGATQLCIRFGYDGAEAKNKLVAILFALDAKGRRVSQYLKVAETIDTHQPTVDEGELPDQLAYSWIDNWSYCLSSRYLDMQYFEVPGLEDVYQNQEDRIIRGYNFKIQETVDALFPIGGGAVVDKMNILFALHGAPHGDQEAPDTSCTFGVILHAHYKNDENPEYGYGEDGSGYYDIATPCPDTCPNT